MRGRESGFSSLSHSDHCLFLAFEKPSLQLMTVVRWIPETLRGTAVFKHLRLFADQHNKILRASRKPAVWRTFSFCLDPPGHITFPTVCHSHAVLCLCANKKPLHICRDLTAHLSCDVTIKPKPQQTLCHISCTPNFILI